MAQISDPKTMRALAHPLRIQLLEMLVARGRATATELAAAVDESPANCSFHLRKLAEFGYIERADDATGREKPWRVIDPEQDFTADEHDPEAVRASTAVGSAIREWEVARLRAAEGRPNPPRWRGATFQRGATMIVTPEEAREISEGLTRLLAPYHERLTDPSRRPPGVGAIRLFAATTFLPEYQETLDAQAAIRDEGPGDDTAGADRS